MSLPMKYKGFKYPNAFSYGIPFGLFLDRYHDIWVLWSTQKHKLIRKDDEKSPDFCKEPFWSVKQLVLSYSGLWTCRFRCSITAAELSWSPVLLTTSIPASIFMVLKEIVWLIQPKPLLPLGTHLKDALRFSGIEDQIRTHCSTFVENRNSWSREPRIWPASPKLCQKLLYRQLKPLSSLGRLCSHHLPCLWATT